jgi:hypothetical protein
MVHTSVLITTQILNQEEPGSVLPSVVPSARARNFARTTQLVLVAILHFACDAGKRIHFGISELSLILGSKLLCLAVNALKHLVSIEENRFGCAAGFIVRGSTKRGTTEPGYSTHPPSWTALTFRLPFTSTAKVTVIRGTPRGAGGMPESSSPPRRALSVNGCTPA